MKLFVSMCLFVFFVACGRETTPVEAPCACPPAPVEVTPAPTQVPVITGPLKFEVRSARFVPSDPDRAPIPLVVTNQAEISAREKCQAALAAPAPALPVWQQEFQNGINTAKLAETQFIAAAQVHRECEHAFVGDEKALTEFQLRYARAMYALATVPDYPFGFPYSESFRHTTVDELVQLLVDSGLTPDQVQPELTGAALAELRKRSFRELYEIYQDQSGKYTEARFDDAVIGLCTQIRKGPRFHAETGLADVEIQQVDCD